MKASQTFGEAFNTGSSAYVRRVLRNKCATYFPFVYSFSINRFSSPPCTPGSSLDDNTADNVEDEAELQCICSQKVYEEREI